MKRIFFATVIILSLSSRALSQTILQEDFTAYQGNAGTAPAGWLFSYHGCYTTGASSGSSGPNSYKFGVDQATLITPYFSGADSLEFWIKGQSTGDSSRLAIMQSPDTTNWTMVTTILPLPTSGTHYELAIDTATRFLQFIYMKFAGNLGFDDFRVFKGDTTPTPPSLDGRIKVYFNNPVDHSVSSGVNAVYLNNTLEDTLVAYISRAEYTIDVALYSFTTSLPDVATAINDAYSRGVHIRWIYDGGYTNTGLASLNSNIPTLGSPTAPNYGIMHNKFMIIDAASANPDDAVVWTGSANWNSPQFTSNVNNVIIFQDQPLAQAYTAEFNEMWGGTGMTPVPANSKFGPDKTDNTPHIFTIDGKTVELYFSPSDGTNSHIQSALSSADHDIFFGIYTFTDYTDADIIKTKIQSGGVYCAGIMDQYSISYTPYSTLSPVMGSNLKIYNLTSIYHNKMAIIDACDPSSDPLVLTGSHNWTISADTKNDENTVIIHDDTIANIFYQSFAQNFADLGGTLQACNPITATEEAAGMEHFVSVYPNPAHDFVAVQNMLNEPAAIRVVELMGRTVALLELAPGQEKHIDVKGWDNSVYFIFISAGNRVFSKKLSVLH